MKKKVMHVLRMSEYSGAENVAIALIRSVSDRFDCVYVSPDGPIREIVEKNGIKHYALNKFDAYSLKKTISDIQPDIIHAHDFMASVLSTSISGKIPVICHLHNNSPWLKKLCTKSVSFIPACIKCKQILTVSDSVMNEYLFGKLFQHKTNVIGNPIDVTAIREKASVAELNDTSDVIFLGRLSQPKNPLLFVEIINELVKQMPSLKVAMVGEGEMRSEVESLIEQYHLGNNIKLYGFQKNPYGLLKASRVMCMPSTWEGFGLAAVEALALGKPVVSSGVGGLPGIVNADCGKICSSKEEYIDMLITLLNEREVYKSCSTHAYIQAERLNNMDLYKDTVVSLYNRILNNQVVNGD